MRRLWKSIKKYLAGSAAALVLSVCAYELGLHQAQTVKENNRVSYIDGNQPSQKAENLTPDEVSKKEGIKCRANRYQDYGSRLCDFSWRPLSLL